MNPSLSRLPDTPVAPFSQLTNQVREYLVDLMDRDLYAIDQLEGSIENSRYHMDEIYSDTNLNVNHDLEIQRLNDITEDDFIEKRRYEQSLALIHAIGNGYEPPIHNTDA